MSIEMFKELTNEQLKEECVAQGITNIRAKNPQKPNKAEYLAAIEAKLSYATTDEEVVEVKEDSVKSKRKAQSPSQLARLEAFRKDRVIVHDVQENQSKDKDELLSVSWGNRLFGGQTDLVSLNGKPQYLRRGAITNLMDATTTIHVPGKNGLGVTKEVVPRFVITEVAGLTPEELEELANKQKLRNSKHA